MEKIITLTYIYIKTHVMKKSILLLTLLFSINILISQCLTYKYANAPFVNPATGPDLNGVTCTNVSGADGNGNYEGGNGIFFLDNSLNNCGSEVETGWYSHDGGFNWHYFDQAGPFFGTYVLGQPNGNPLLPSNGSTCSSCSDMVGISFYVTPDNGGSPECGGVSADQAGSGKHYSLDGNPVNTINRTSVFRVDCSLAPSGWYSLNWDLGAGTGEFFFWDGGGGWGGGSSSCGGALPIDLVSFDGEVIGRSVKLDWVVASQINNDYFTIKKTDDFNEWEDVSIVDGIGNTSTEMTYTIYDENPKEGVTYYRLSQTDYDGTTKSFLPIAITIKGDNGKIIKSINLWGQPIKDSYQGIIIQIWDNGVITKTFKNQ